MTAAQIEARDRRLSAIHEAGHLVIARWAGLSQAQAIIFRNPDASAVNDLDQKKWIGKAFLPDSLRRLSQVRRAMIGVAGAVAEAVWTGDADLLDDDAIWADPGIMSEADWGFAGCLPGCPDLTMDRAVDKVCELLTVDLRSELYNTSRELMSRARLMQVPAREHGGDAARGPRRGRIANSSAASPTAPILRAWRANA